MDSEVIINAHITGAKKEKLLKLIPGLLKIALIRRSEGIVGIEEEINKMNSDFLKIAIKLLMAGHSHEKVEEILTNIILAESGKDEKGLERLMLFRAIMTIIYGYGLDVLKMNMLSVLDETWLNDFIGRRNKEWKHECLYYKGYVQR